MMSWSIASWFVALFARRTVLFAWTLAFLCCFPGRALALTIVPMCGEHAESVAAPPISRAAREVPLSCERRGGASFDDADPGRAPAPPLSSVEAVPRLPPLVYRFCPVPRTRTPVEQARSGELTGHLRELERPPRR